VLSPPDVLGREAYDQSAGGTIAVRIRRTWFRRWEDCEPEEEDVRLLIQPSIETISAYDEAYMINNGLDYWVMALFQISRFREHSRCSVSLLSRCPTFVDMFGLLSIIAICGEHTL
jgi:hypothetical protein